MNWDYLAGFVDGEGSIGITSMRKGQQFVPFLSIGNTNQQILKDIRDFLAIGYVTNGYNSKRNAKTIYHYKLEGRSLLPVLLSLTPLLVVKKQQAVLVTKWIAQRIATPRSKRRGNGRYTDEDHAIRFAVQALNKRGL